MLWKKQKPLHMTCTQRLVISVLSRKEAGITEGFVFIAGSLMVEDKTEAFPQL